MNRVFKAVCGAALCAALAGSLYAQNDYQFRQQDKDQLRGHYQTDVKKYQAHPENRTHYSAGQHLTADDVHHFKAMPNSYHQDMPTPPEGYRYGYYQGNVVVYDSATMLVADVADLIGQ